MSISSYQTDRVFENRLYISPLARSAIEKAIYGTKGEEYTGAGVRSYDKVIGWFLSFFGLASKLTIDGESFYVNNKSFTKLIIRRVELEKVGSVGEMAKKLHDLFIEHKKTGYNKNQVNAVNNKLKQFLIKNHEIKDLTRMKQIINELERVALDHI